MGFDKNIFIYSNTVWQFLDSQTLKIFSASVKDLKHDYQYLFAQCFSIYKRGTTISDFTVKLQQYNCLVLLHQGQQNFHLKPLVRKSLSRKG
jgi:hypothetical protein